MKQIELMKINDVDSVTILSVIMGVWILAIPYVTQCLLPVNLLVNPKLQETMTNVVLTTNYCCNGVGWGLLITGTVFYIVYKIAGINLWEILFGRFITQIS